MLSVAFVAFCVALRPHLPKKGDLLLAVCVFLPFVLVSTLVSWYVGIDYIRVWSFHPYIPAPLLVIIYQAVPLLGWALVVIAHHMASLRISRSK